MKLSLKGETEPLFTGTEIECAIEFEKTYSEAYYVRHHDGLRCYATRDDSFTPENYIATIR